MPREAIPLLQRAVAISIPNSKQAWNDLGLAYLRLGQFDEAAAAFQKQLEVESFRRARLQLSRPHAAAAAKISRSRRRVPQTDRDESARPRRARRARRSSSSSSTNIPKPCRNSIKPRFSRRTTPNSKSASARRYLNTGEKDKALAAFEKGVELSPTPAVWNNVAYDSGRAQYRTRQSRSSMRESAIAATAANLRNIDFAPHARRSQSKSQASASIGTRSGWVYFQKGDLDQAERYIRAAWLLNAARRSRRSSRADLRKARQKDRSRAHVRAGHRRAHAVPDTRARLTLLLGGNAKSTNSSTTAKTRARRKFASFPAGRSAERRMPRPISSFCSRPVQEESQSRGREIRQRKSGPAALRRETSRHDFGPMFPDASPAKSSAAAPLPAPPQAEPAPLP